MCTLGRSSFLLVCVNAVATGGRLHKSFCLVHELPGDAALEARGAMHIEPALVGVTGSYNCAWMCEMSSIQTACV